MLHITVLSAPSPPRNLQLTVLSATSIKAEWQKPLTENGKLRRYVVSYGKARDKLDTPRFTPNTEYDLTSLEEYTEYFVQVHAETSVSGDPSDIKQATTDEAGEFFAV